MQGLSEASTLSEFETQQKEAVASLRYPDFCDIINITLPAECHVLNATMNISTVSPSQEFPNGPNNVQIKIDDTVLYNFNGTNNGGFGTQSCFCNGNTTVRIPLHDGFGFGNTSLNLPATANIQNASLDAAFNGIGTFDVIWNWTGDLGEGFSYGFKTGDVNNDGYDDFLFCQGYNESKGPYTGSAYLFYGDTTLDAVEDVIFEGNASYDLFGYTAQGLGDINGDGFDDIGIDALWDDTGASDGGAVYIYFGGNPMDNISDIVITGNKDNQQLGLWITGGNVNGDEYDDIIISSDPDYDQGIRKYAEVSVYFGGKKINQTPDILLVSPEPDSRYYMLPDELPDLNGDGFDDIIVGALASKEDGIYYGKTYLYYGAKEMDNISDLCFSGNLINGSFGTTVEGAGDFNGDGYVDLFVSDPQWIDPIIPGIVYLYLGGPAMDNTSDLIIQGKTPNDYFGTEIGSIGDLNKDGFDDIFITAASDSTNGPNAGAFNIFLGSDKPDNESDYSIYGNEDEQLGWPAVCFGDVNADGEEDILIVKAINLSIGHFDTQIYSHKPGLLNTAFVIGSQELWNKTGYSYGLESIDDFSKILNDYLKEGTPSQKDEFGNSYINIPINFSADCDGEIILSNLSTTYSLSMPTIEFSDILNNYILDNKIKEDKKSNISISIRASSEIPGQIKLKDLKIDLDLAPQLIIKIPDISINEDTIAPDVIDFHDYFSDDFQQSDMLKYEISCLTNETFVDIIISNNRYLSLDMLNGTKNDNWTGAIDFIVKCSDRWNSQTESNKFRVNVQNVQDPPVFMSMPPLKGTAGVQYMYQPFVIDGDMDPITYSLNTKPPETTIDSKSGLVIWTPKAGGDYPVSINATDGQFNVFQNFSINVPNQYPNITSSPNTTAITTVPYEYLVKASDADGDNLTYSLVSEIQGMTIDSGNGTVSWTPQTSGDYTVKIMVVDGKGGEAFQEFLIHVYEKVEPKMEFVSLPEKAKVEGTVNVSIGITNGSLNVVNVQYRLDSGEWVNLSMAEDWELTLDTTKMKNGAHKLEIRVYDGQDYTEVATRSFTVSNPIKAAEQPFPIMPIAVILILAITAGGLLLWKGKRPPDEEE